jgi:zinc protease
MNFSFVFPPADEFRLDNGLSVICMPDHEQSGLVFALQFPVGRFADPPGKEGLCELTAALLLRGTQTFPPEEFSSRIENTGASFFSDIGEEHCILGLRMLAVSAARLFPLFVEVVRSPLFAKEEFVRLRHEMVTALRAEANNPSFIAIRHFYKELAGDGHPAGRFQTPASLKNITLAEAERFFIENFSPRGSLCIVAGDCEGKRLRTLCAEQLSFWKKPRIRGTFIAAAVGRVAQPVIRLINKPDLTQATVMVGHGAPGEGCADKNALSLANHIFGSGNFSSRLMTRIRSVGGKTYGVSSQLVAETGFGALLISTVTQNNRTQEVLRTILEEHRRFCTQGVTAEELVKAKQFAIGNMAFQLEGIGNIVDKLLWLRFYGRQNSYIERFEAMIEAIDVDTVNAVVRKYFAKESCIIIVVGKRTEVESQLRSFGPLRHFHFRDKV